MGISTCFILLFACMACFQVLFVEARWKCPTNDCKFKYRRVGCYKDDGQRPLPEEMLNERDPTSKEYGGRSINWDDWDNYIESFACRCAEKAREAGYSVFGLQFYGECWSGPGLDAYKKVGAAPYSECVGPQRKPCTKSSRHCVGEQFRNFVYEIIPDCDVPLERLGCYDDKEEKAGRPLPDYYLTDKDKTRTNIYSGKTIDWINWDVYMPELVCRCAKKAKEMGRTTFGVQNYGECWTGIHADVTYSKDGPSTRCIDRCLQPCQPYKEYCAGKTFANSVYRLADAPCELKTTPEGCYQASDGALGTLLLDAIHPTSKMFTGELLDISEWDSQFPKLLCRCAREAKKLGFSSFGVHNKGICWGKHGGWSSHGESECFIGDKKCPLNSDQCAGGKESIFVYKVTKPTASPISKKSFIPKFKEDGVSIEDLLEV